MCVIHLAACWCVIRYLVGVVANQGELDEHSSLKGAHFVRLCSLRGIPLIFLVNTPSDADFLSVHGSPGMVTKARAQMIATLATSLVPKITVVCGGSYGPSAYAMVRELPTVNIMAIIIHPQLIMLQCGKAMEPHFMFCWPHARMGVASPKHLSDYEPITSEEELKKLESEYPTSALIHDGVILPSETRKVLTRCSTCISLFIPPPPPFPGD